MMLPKTVCAIQHVGCETPGLIAEVLSTRGIAIQGVRVFANEPLPGSIEGLDGLVVMGGPMGVYAQDTYPFLKDEIRLLRRAVEAGKPVLGVCLGSQLLAAALGAEVTKGPRKEIGWYPVTLTPEASRVAPWDSMPPRFTPLHWHGDVFELPPGAVSLASSELTRHQAFACGRGAWGILFHIEVTETIVAGMVRTFADELRGAGVNARSILAEGERHLRALRALAESVVGAWASLL
ncbi:MAG TPA: gamma-glutamyl-gamma-aminobutyrate hydrolase family protein [Verrucomicrobiota bacterium]|nr:gamma-glutamyl-gamma-aminobutyrate hydrolase family protein [Verrucomicrobiota bacterium]HRZ36157.1 gamma-glutamyl-gamma-aminobutyrate hydrolase family protein [Candidatus Paceibacterota bacterium]HRZ58665.1 gamma-glutamyl-gamma-aminobutyrate hydrolase family protein [Candidatus Paceibacterota bacterium]